MRAIFILAILITGAFSGCVSDVANRYYLSQKFPPKSAEQVTVLYSKPTQKFEVVADFQSRNESTESLRSKAAEIGADAVIVSNLGGSYSFNEQWAGTDRFSGTGTRVVGTAIRYQE